MKKIVCLFIALAMVCGGALAEFGLTDFTAVDTEGNVVTQDAFAAYDLTVVNVWATWCGYCVEEMPYFSELKAKLPENVNFITICTDAPDNLELARDILRASNPNFQTLVGNAKIERQLTSQVYAYPTTFFLDSRGISIAEPIVGVPSVSDPVGGYYGAVTAVLEQMREAA